MRVIGTGSAAAVRWAVCGVLALGLLLACDSDDECEPAPLSKACEDFFGCPKDKKSAVVVACENPQGFGNWEESSNGCGGTTVRSSGLVSVEFDFDTAGKLAGVTSWDDVPERCDSVYGAPCEQPGGSWVTMECLTSTDGGSRP